MLLKGPFSLGLRHDDVLMRQAINAKLSFNLLDR
jgi:hypothetical protein|tara:strand:- start:6558 stop:6659 length:102 start_codon:yes stop_codon:yes gene_type:complete